ncbi:hypothetical protein FBEOM_4135 [Fusarium beomiforme]|uniref:Uncharacterized protein n=1 Tax=Fusarium beomiforme TaxID=44412 RepID=A0A9P5E0U9_9HYPO|nr:hypothetical protein FBEOM_4135 [Fusarium beomiforme]
MHFLSLLLAAVVASGSPAPGSKKDAMNLIGGDEIVEHVRLKRDVLLHAQDIYEAEKYRVNPREMYKHSILRRSNGDHVSIWVHKSFNGSFFDNDKQTNHIAGLTRRDLGIDVVNQHTELFEPGENKKKCRKPTIKRLTDSGSPTTDRALAILRWTNMNLGAFHLSAGCCFHATDLLVAGSNHGTNMRFTVRKESGGMFLGSEDIAKIAKRVVDKHSKQIGGAWRVAAEGKMNCHTGHNREFKKLWWDISRSDQQVGVSDRDNSRSNEKTVANNINSERKSDCECRKDSGRHKDSERDKDIESHSDCECHKDSRRYKDSGRHEDTGWHPDCGCRKDYGGDSVGENKFGKWPGENNPNNWPLLDDVARQRKDSERKKGKITKNNPNGWPLLDD